MIEITFDGKPVQVKTLEYTIDKSTIDDVPPLLDLGIAEQTLTLNVYYYQLMWLANMVYPQNPKKAKRIRNLAEQHNPYYRIAGRPPVYVLALEYGTGKRVLVRGVAQAPHYRPRHYENHCRIRGATRLPNQRCNI